MPIREICYSEIRKAMKDEPYTMELVTDDAKIVSKLVNQGIDSHLEACYVPARGDNYEVKDRRLPPSDKFPEGAVIARKLHCTVSVESLPTLLRRLVDYADKSGEDDADDAMHLAVSILDTLKINVDAGCFRIAPDREMNKSKHMKEVLRRMVEWYDDFNDDDDKLDGIIADCRELLKPRSRREAKSKTQDD